MKCVVCPCTDISLLKLQTYIDHKTLNEITFILPDIAFPSSQDPVYVCTLCLEEVSSFFTIKKLCLDNLCRLSYYNDTLKARCESKGSDLKVVINNDAVSIRRKQIIDFKVNSDHKELLSSEGKEVAGSFTDEEKQSRFNCPDCDKVFNHRNSLVRHTRIHTGERPYKCPTCQKTFLESGHLNQHKLTHTGEKPHECDICHKTFTQTSHLLIHKRIHTNERPYQCSVCNKAYTLSSHLSTHMRTHTGEKPYQCHVCEYKCAQAGSLQRHIRTHTGEKPYTCKFCKESFSHSKALKKHHQTIHKDEYIS